MYLIVTKERGKPPPPFTVVIVPLFGEQLRITLNVLKLFDKPRPSIIIMIDG